MSTHYKFRPVGGMDVFYREAGSADAPVVPLLDGIPSANPVFRGLIPRLSNRGCNAAATLVGLGRRSMRLTRFGRKDTISILSFEGIGNSHFQISLGQDATDVCNRRMAICITLPMLDM